MIYGKVKCHFHGVWNLKIKQCHVILQCFIWMYSLFSFKYFSMKLSRLKSIWQESPRIIIQCRGSREFDRGGGIPMTIRQRLSSAVSAAGQEQCILDSCSISPTCREPRVIIVGAGMAGLSAAHRLTQCGIRNYVVLEAKERYVSVSN